MPFNLACLGVLGGHGRVRVGEKRLALPAPRRRARKLVVHPTEEAILRYAQVSKNVLADVVLPLSSNPSYDARELIMSFATSQ